MEIIDMSLEDLLSSLYQDFELLQDGTWVPDADSCEASQDVIQAIALRLGLRLSDRNGNEVENTYAGHSIDYQTFLDDHPEHPGAKEYDV